MYSEDFELTLDGNWQALPVKDFFIAVQIENVTTEDVEIKMKADATTIRTLESGVVAEWKTMDTSKPFRNAGIKAKGVSGQVLKGEQWLYDYQVNGS
jgi:uncharacterized protein YwbE